MCHRLWLRFTPCEGQDVSLHEVINDYSIQSGQKQNLPAENELGRLIRRIFPATKKIRKFIHADGIKKRCWFYRNLKKCTHQTKLTFKDLAGSYSPPKPANSSMCWVQNKVEGFFFQWVIIPDDCTCDGKRHIRELRLYENSYYELYVMSQKVANVLYHLAMASKHLFKRKNSLTTCLNIVQQFHFVKGSK